MRVIDQCTLGSSSSSRSRNGSCASSMVGMRVCRVYRSRRHRHLKVYTRMDDKVSLKCELTIVTIGTRIWMMNTLIVVIITMLIVILNRSDTKVPNEC